MRRMTIAFYKILILGLCFFASPSQAKERFAVIATNDIHGQTEPRIARATTGEPFAVGGVDLLGAYVRAARKYFGPSLFWFDAGDRYQGSIESNTFAGKPIEEMMSTLGLTAATIGNHEFDFGSQEFIRRMREGRFPILCANIISESTGKYPRWQNVKPFEIFQIGQVKIGVTGLAGVDTPLTTNPKNLAGLRFLGYREAFANVYDQMRRKGAQYIFIIIHDGARCDANDLASCKPQGAFTDFMATLSPGVVDLIVTGHLHSVLRNVLNGIPVVQSATGSELMSFVEFFYSIENGLVKKHGFNLHPPVHLCGSFVGRGTRCSSDSAGPLRPATWLGQVIQPDPEVRKLMQPYRNKVAPFRDKQVGSIVNTIHNMPKDRENEMGNLVTNAMLEMFPDSQVAVINGGGIRSSLEAGRVSFGQVFNVFPFDNLLVKMRMKGRSLLDFLRIGFSGASSSVFSVAGVRVAYDPAKDAAIAEDWNRDGIRSDWERNRVVEIRLADGRAINPDATYQVLSNDYLLSSQATYGWAYREMNTADVTVMKNSTIRDAVVTYLMKHPGINGEQTRLVDPVHPRVILSGGGS